MKKLLSIILLFMALSLMAGAATVKGSKDMKFKPVAPNMDSIKMAVNDVRSDFYYKRLWRKFQANDTSMSMQAYRHLYLGYVFQEDYNPYRESEYTKKIQPLYYKKTHTPAECDTIIKYAELSLADDPFDLNQMQFFIYALKEKKKYAKASIWQYRLNHLVQAIISTGLGTQEKPWVVTSPTHEYVIANFLGYTVTDHKEYEGDIDYIIFDKPKDKGPEGFYFDVSNILKMYNLKFPGQQ